MRQRGCSLLGPFQQLRLGSAATAKLGGTFEADSWLRSPWVEPLPYSAFALAVFSVVRYSAICGLVLAMDSSEATSGFPRVARLPVSVQAFRLLKRRVRAMSGRIFFGWREGRG